jgi:D-alanyl-D-alanine carboxypeptidase (penicillin-binding protein 5/6)
LVALAAVGGLIGYQVTRPLPVPSLAAAWLTSARQPGGTGFTWPTAARESAVSVSGLDGMWASADQHAVPIASVTKMMTAYLVLRDHPLVGDAEGPSITVTSADVATYQADVAANDSNAQVAAGEVISERQALEALMLPSADNIALLLANWDAGSVSAFAAKMNAQARALGMTGTTYTDPSGLAASTVSTARDQLILVRKAMATPAFAGIVAMPSAVIPVAGTVRNFNHRVGTDGIVGIKTGSDTAAQGCWAFAIQRVVAGKQRVVYGVVLGVAASFAELVPQAVDAAVALADSVPSVVRPLTVLPAGTVVGHVRVPWSKGLVPVVTARALSGLAVAGTRVTVTMSMTAPGSVFAAGQQVGSISAGGITGTSSAALVTGAGSGSPTLAWRLTRLRLAGGQELGQVGAGDLRQVLQLGAAGEAVGQDRRVRAGAPDRRQQGGLRDRDRDVVVAALDPEVAGEAAASAHRAEGRAGFPQQGGVRLPASGGVVMAVWLRDAGHVAQVRRRPALGLAQQLGERLDGPGEPLRPVVGG